MSVEAYAGDAGNVVGVVEGDGVDESGVVLVEDTDGEGGCEWYFKAARQSIATSTRDDAEGGIGTVDACDDIVDAAIAAYGGDNVEALVGTLAG